ncbi:MAG: hypothetical protein AUJ88_09685 [Gallionellaceae bacterium CG1_02_56_997]|nr:MAG: hypothetical protein AUJ88_09685 [Gallionellaceae bacterium CG1_02_56_997]
MLPISIPANRRFKNIFAVRDMRCWSVKYDYKSIGWLNIGADFLRVQEVLGSALIKQKRSYVK